MNSTAVVIAVLYGAVVVIALLVAVAIARSARSVSHEDPAKLVRGENRWFGVAAVLLLGAATTLGSYGPVTEFDMGCTSDPAPEILSSPPTAATVDNPYVYYVNARWFCFFGLCNSIDAVTLPPGAEVDDFYDSVSWTPPVVLESRQVWEAAQVADSVVHLMPVNFVQSRLRLAGMVLLANGWRVAVLVATFSTVVVGSKMVRSPPERFSDWEKSPARSRSVGIVRMESRGSFVRQPSYAKKLKTLFLRIGPPMVPSKNFESVVAFCWFRSRWNGVSTVQDGLARFVRNDPEKSLPFRPYHAHDERQWLKPGEPVECQVEIWPTSMVFRKGHKLRLDISPADGVGTQHFTHFHADYNAGAETTLYSGGDRASYLLLPIIPPK